MTSNNGLSGLIYTGDVADAKKASGLIASPDMHSTVLSFEAMEKAFSQIQKTRKSEEDLNKDREIKTRVDHSKDTDKIVLPVNMDKRAAAKELTLQWENEEKETSFTAAFENWNWQDVLVAVKRVTESTFGWMNAQDTEATFFNPAQPPVEIDVVTDIHNGKNVNEKAFYGNFQLTPWENAKGSIVISEFGVVALTITGKRKYSTKATEYFNAIRTQMETKSIYRGKSIVATGSERRGINFEIIENKGSDKIVLNHAERMVVDTFVIDGLGEPGKRCYLFTGAYGTGKTETAMLVGREAVQRHGMSFFYLKDAAMFDAMLSQSKQYQPCIIFLEDVDEIASGDDRDAAMNKILNTLDGVQTKGNDLTVIFTTNHPEKLNKALRRPGRIDLMIKFEYPDDHTREEIYRAYFKHLKGYDNLDYVKLSGLTGYVQGAVIAEIAKRALKLARKYDNTITDDIVESCIHSMKYQIELMNENTEEKSEDAVFVESFKKIIYDQVQKQYDAI